MDWQNPLRSISPTVDADVLQVLARTHEPVTGNRLAQLAGRSYAQVHAVVGRLVDHGIVDVQQVGRTYAYSLNRSHSLANGITASVAAPEDVESSIRDAVTGWAIQPASVAIFGSAARRTATHQSDVDLLIIRDDDVDEDDPVWSGQVGDLAHTVETISGNRVQIVDLRESELNETTADQQPLIASLQYDARTLAGTEIRELTAERVAPG
ncbi:MAG: nucleotidyltransferase domain-containing protein [Actinomycetia bacterium]|nr:nucleotidyltransferase domain-containing protein [Actinomycetes bacterium]